MAPKKRRLIQLLAKSCGYILIIRKSLTTGWGIYFWENDPARGLEWAASGKKNGKIKRPDVVGAIIDLGLCLDLTTRTGLEEVQLAYVLNCIQ